MINSVQPSAGRPILPEQDPSTVDQTAQTSSADTVETDDASATYVYSKEEIKKYCEDTAAENLRYLVEELIRHQGKLRNQSAISLPDMNQAKQAISENGEFGVQAVSDRIVDFAISACGNDKSKLETMKAAIEEGFSQAREAFGGTLPDICNQTHDEIMRKLDEWAGSEDVEQ